MHKPLNDKVWGLSDDELAVKPTVYRDDLLKDRVVLLSGGGSGMGKAMAYLCARLGAQVVICGRRTEKLQETADAIRSRIGAEVAIKSMTIRDPEQVDALMDETFERFGRLDVLVNNAGGQYPSMAIDYTKKGWNAVIDTNLNGTWHMMQAAAQRWRGRGEPGNVINIVANVSRGMPQSASTCAARAGVIYLSKTVAVEWAPLKIRVNCVAPGSIATEGLNVYPASATARIAESNPMKEVGDGWGHRRGDRLSGRRFSQVHYRRDVDGRWRHAAMGLGLARWRAGLLQRRWQQLTHPLANMLDRRRWRRRLRRHGKL